MQLRDLQRDARAKAAIYETHLARAQQIGERQQIDTSNVRVISSPMPPKARSWPPRTLILLAAAVMLGLVLGIAAGAGAWGLDLYPSPAARSYCGAAMGSAAKGEADRGEKLRETVGTALFMAIFLFFWISLNPFVDLTGEAVLDPSAGNSNLMNQVVSLLLFAGTLAYGLLHPMRSIILQPRVLLGLLFAWFFLVSLISSYPMLGIKGTVLAVMVTVNASIYLLLPASERHFAKMLGIGTLIMLGVSYYGILFKPLLAIHQASELREPMNAGLWRGHFPHKNSAAAAMVVASFFGLFVMNAWSRIAGMTILCLSFLFLINTGGKTFDGHAAGYPSARIWAFEKVRFLRIPIVIGGVGAFNIFSNRGCGLQAAGRFHQRARDRCDFYQPRGYLAVCRLRTRGPATDRIRLQGFLADIGARPQRRLDQNLGGCRGKRAQFLSRRRALMTGIPGLLLTLVWLVVLPLRNISRLEPDAEHSHLHSALHPHLALCHLQCRPREPVLRRWQLALVHLAVRALRPVPAGLGRAGAGAPDPAGRGRRACLAYPNALERRSTA